MSMGGGDGVQQSSPQTHHQNVKTCSIFRGDLSSKNTSCIIRRNEEGSVPFPLNSKMKPMFVETVKTQIF